MEVAELEPGAGGVEVVGLGRAGAAALGALVAVAVEGLLV